MSGRRRAVAVGSVAVVVGLWAAVVWLRGIDPDVERAIEEERGARYCFVTLNRIALALSEEGVERVPDAWNAVEFEGRIPDRCPRDLQPSGPSYALAPGLRLPAPSHSILAHELRPNHPIPTAGGESVLCHRILLGNLSVEYVSGRQLQGLLRLQDEARQGIGGADFEALLDAVSERRTPQRRAFAAQELAAREPGARRAEVVAGLTAALAIKDYLWVELEMAYALGALGERRAALEAVLERLVRPAGLNYFERRRATRFVASQATAEEVADYGAGPELGLEPLLAGDPEATAARRLLEWWRARPG